MASRYIAVLVFYSLTGLVDAVSVTASAKRKEDILICKKLFNKKDHHSKRSLNTNYKAQNGQDVIVEQNIFNHILNDSQPGTFVEFGARDGLLGSNTYYFETTLGWKGLLAEPTEDQYSQLVINRNLSAVAALNGVFCANETGVREYIEVVADGDDIGWRGRSGFKTELMEIGALSKLQEKANGLDSPIHPNNPYTHHIPHIHHNTDPNSTVVMKSKWIQCMDLKQELLTRGMTHVNFLSVDCEGCEHEVLTNFDFSAVQVGIVPPQLPLPTPAILPFCVFLSSLKCLLPYKPS